jgi:hypothetical protein
LDIPGLYQKYWELKGMYGLAQIYEEAKYDLHDLLRLHRIVKDLGMDKEDILEETKKQRSIGIRQTQSITNPTMESSIP